MHRKYSLLLIALLLATGIARSEGGHRLISHAPAVTVEISPQPPGRRLVFLPELEFPMRINADCNAGASAESLSISIADTLQTIGADELNTDAAGEVAIETTIRVPRRQIAPIAIEHFCNTEDGGGATAQLLLVPAALALNVSLRCSSEAAQSIQYASLPLRIRLLCIPVDDERTDTPPDQESLPLPESF